MKKIVKSFMGAVLSAVIALTGFGAGALASERIAAQRTSVSLDVGASEIVRFRVHASIKDIAVSVTDRSVVSARFDNRSRSLTLTGLKAGTARVRVADRGNAENNVVLNVTVRGGSAFKHPPVMSLGGTPLERRHLFINGTVWAWGYGNTDSQGNIRQNLDVAMTPRKIIEDVVHFTFSEKYRNRTYAAIKNDGSLWVWGYDLGYMFRPISESDNFDYIFEPVKIMDNVTDVQTNNYVMLALKADGTIWGWGENDRGLFGNGKADGKADKFRPVKIIDNVSSFSLGDTHAMAIKKDGSLWGWGSNGVVSGGLLGTGRTQELSPVKVMDAVKYVAATKDATFAIKNDNSLWGWGSNEFYEHLGIGKQKYIDKPVKIMDGVAMVYPNSQNTFAVKTDGSLWGWGSNYSGMMGNGERISRSNVAAGTAWSVINPVKIMNDVDFVSTASAEFMMVIKKDGSLWSWGDNNDGRLGRGEYNNLHFKDKHEDFSPRKIMDDVIYVTSSGSYREYTVAIKRDGSMWTWGEWALANGKDIIAGSRDSSTGTPTRFMNISELEALSRVKPAVPPEQISTEPVTIKESNVYVWNDYMPGTSYNGSLCVFNIEVASSHRNVQRIDISVSVTAASLGASPVNIYRETVSHDFGKGSFRYRFRPDDFGSRSGMRLKDGESYSMRVSVRIGDVVRSVTLTGEVEVTH